MIRCCFAKQFLNNFTQCQNKSTIWCPLSLSLIIYSIHCVLATCLMMATQFWRLEREESSWRWHLGLRPGDSISLRVKGCSILLDWWPIREDQEEEIIFEGCHFVFCTFLFYSRLLHFPLLSVLPLSSSGLMDRIVLSSQSAKSGDTSRYVAGVFKDSWVSNNCEVHKRKPYAMSTCILL